MAGIDSYTKLMLHCNGDDESTTFTDSSASAHSPVAQGSAQIDTAQSKFGGASGLFGAFTDYLSIGDSEDWDFGSGDFTIDCWIRLNSNTPSTTICSRVTSGSSYLYIAWEGGNLRVRDYGGTIDFSKAVTETTGSWFHLAIVRNGNDFMIFKDGVQQGTTYTSSASFIDRSVSLDIGRMSQNGSYYLDGWIDEFRVSKGIARWTTDFSGSLPDEEYSIPSETALIEDTVTLNDGWTLQLNPETGSLSDTITISESWDIHTNPEQESLSESITLDDSWTSETNPKIVSLSESITLDDSWEITEVEYINNAIKILSYNPLLIVTQEDPVKLVYCDVSTPSSPVFTAHTLSGIANASDMWYNSEEGYIYVFANTGKIEKIDINDLESSSTIDVSDTSNFLGGECLDDFFLTYGFTNDSDGEIYLLDNRDTVIIDTDFQCLEEKQSVIDTNFWCLDSTCALIDTDLQCVATVETIIETDLKCLSASTISSITPIAQTDFHVYIDDVELGDTDLRLDSIEIQHNESEKSSASFILTRKHDDINTTLSGSTVIINNQNGVKIYIKDVLEFDGKISELNCQYNIKEEYVQVTALMDQPTEQYNTVTMSLAGITEKLNLYHVHVQNPIIYNPYVSATDEDPVIYKGVTVSLGNKIEQQISRNRYLGNSSTLAEKLKTGDFQPTRNWSYYFFAFAKHLQNGIEWATARYLGTSLNSLSIDIWKINGATYYNQKQYEDDESSLDPFWQEISSDSYKLVWSNGDEVEYDSAKELQDAYDLEVQENGLGYAIGVAPFKQINCQTGWKKTKTRWVDVDDGLYSVIDEAYDYREYAQKIADLEYSKMTDLSGNILPQTNCTIVSMIDAYQYYNIKLLTRIRIDNTTTENIYVNQNGFPVSVKSISISSSSMQVTLNCSNMKSNIELETIDGEFPEETDEMYVTTAKQRLHARKFDPNANSYLPTTEWNADNIGIIKSFNLHQLPTYGAPWE